MATDFSGICLKRTNWLPGVTVFTRKCQIKYFMHISAVQGVPVHKDKFKIRIMVGLSYTRKHSWSNHPQHQNDQYWSLFVEWIIKNPIFYWYLVPSVSEAVEASLCNFLEFFLMKLKCWILGNMLTTMNVF